MAPDCDVVGNVYEIIDFGAGADGRVAAPPRSIAVPAPISNLSSMITRPTWGDFDEFVRFVQITEPTLTDMAAGMYDYVLTDNSVSNRCIGSD
jgi:hypothetical protein